MEYRAQLNAIAAWLVCRCGYDIDRAAKVAGEMLRAVGVKPEGG